MESSQSDGYIQPWTAWLVEYVDPRQPGEGSFQVAAFTTEEVAVRFKEELERGGYWVELRINLVSVHQRIEDWEWDR